MKNSITVRTYEHDDELEIVRLLNLAYPQRKPRFTQSWWKWKYRNTSENLIAIAEHKGTLIGHMGLVPLRMKVGNRTITSCQGVDLVVHPHFRRRGIFLALAKALLEQSRKEKIPIWYMTPPDISYHGHLKYGCVDVCRIDVAIRPTNTYNALLRNFERAKCFPLPTRLFSRVVDTFSSTLSRITKTEQGDLVISECSIFDHRVDDLWNRVSSSHEIIIVRDSEYLNWRYCECDFRRYDIKLVESEGRVVGYAVLAVGGEEDRSGFIADILSDSAIVFRLLVQTSVESLIQKGVDVVTFWIPPESSYQWLLKLMGFLPSPTRVRLIAYLASETVSTEFVSQGKKWYFTMGDCDWL